MAYLVATKSIILLNEGNWKYFYRQNVLVKKKTGNYFFDQSVSTKFFYECMVIEEVLKYEDDKWSFDSIKKFTLASFYKWKKKNKQKKKRKTYFYSCKEIFIRTG